MISGACLSSHAGSIITSNEHQCAFSAVVILRDNMNGPRIGGKVLADLVSDKFNLSY